MDLVDKVKSAGRKTALAFTLGSSLVLGGSGCQPLATVIAGGLVANAIRNSNKQEVVYVQQEKQDDVQRENLINQDSWRPFFFTCNYYKGDLDGDGISESSEYEGFNKRIFDKDEKVGMCCEVYKQKGNYLQFNITDKETKETIKSEIIFIDRNFGGWVYSPERQLKPGKYIAIAKISDKNNKDIAEETIEIFINNQS